MSISKLMKEELGRPAFMIDGKPEFASYMWTGTPTPDGYPGADAAKIYAEAGVHNYAINLGSDPEWPGPGKGEKGNRVPEDHFNFSNIKAQLERLIEVDPKARFHLRLEVEKYFSDHWWFQMYPGEMEVTEGGGFEVVQQMRQPAQSYASIVWRDQVKVFLREYVHHIEKIGMSDRVIAWQTGHGFTGECFKWSAVGQEIGDFSTPMKLYFQSWLMKKYNNDEKTLREAWADSNVTFDTAKVPTRDQQLYAKNMTLRDPSKEQNVIDYYKSYADLNADLVIDFNKTIKEEIGDKALTGAFYGYIFELTGNDSYWGIGKESRLGGLQRSGQLGFRKLIESPYIDFIATPYIYFLRSIGGECSPQQPVESTRIHNKMFILEDDTRTHLGLPEHGYGRGVDLSDTIAILRRNMSAALVRGLSIWWLGENGSINAAKEPAFGPLLTRFQELGNWALQLDNRPCAEIAVMLDDESLYYETITNDLSLPNITQQRVWGLPRIGAPFDCYLLQDFIDGKVPSAKLCIFMNAFSLTEERRAALSKELKKDGRTALWIYAPGYIKGNDMSVDYMEELTGLKFDKSEFPWGPLMHITDFDHEITEKLSEELFWGTNNPLGPIFNIDDPDAKVLGEVVHSQGRCDSGFAVKSFPDWNSVYIAAPNIPASVLRGIAKFAGVHLYSGDGDILYANKQLLAVHTIKGGQRKISLPEKAEVVYDLFEKKIIAENTDVISIDLPERSTSLFFTGDSGFLKNLDKGGFIAN